ncbi:hypothetical protein GGI04_000662 [Coemansia thaxteri]|nr:hypothetical protein GGI04_000662 [Coemansia thaxteri]
MEIRLDEFSQASFDVKAWVNGQFAAGAGSGDGASADGLAQRLTTQLQILATTAQQGNDRLRARQRHQAAQTGRDVAGVAQALQAARRAAADFAAAGAGSAQAAAAVRRVVAIDGVRARVQQAAAALDSARRSSALPQKIGALVAGGDLAQAWDQIIIIGGSSGGSAVREQLMRATEQQLRDAAGGSDAARMGEAVRLLAAHSADGDDLACDAYLSQRPDGGARRLRAALAAGCGLGGALDLMGSVIADERAFVDAAGLQHVGSQLLEAVLERLAAELQPTVRGVVGKEADEESAGLDLARVADAYGAVAAFYIHVFGVVRPHGGGESADAAPESLRLLFEPFAAHVAGMAGADFARIRGGALDRLRAAVGAREYGEAAAAMRQAIGEAEQAVGRAASLCALAAAAGDAADALVGEMAAVVARASAAVGGAGAAVCEPLTSERKLACVADAVGAALLARELHAGAARIEAGVVEAGAVEAGATGARQLLAGFMESRADRPIRSAGRGSGEAVGGACRGSAAAVLAALTGAFRPALGRVAAAGVWHAAAATKSAMNVAVPLFSCSPSEEAVDIADRMHVLLPELEQIGVMDAQAVGDSSLQPLYAFMLDWLQPGEEPLPHGIAPVLALVLGAVLRDYALQISRIPAPLSAHGRQQLAADVDYISAVAASFGVPPPREFDAVRAAVLGGVAGESESEGDGDGDGVAAVRTAIHALLGHDGRPVGGY